MESFCWKQPPLSCGRGAAEMSWFYQGASRAGDQPLATSYAERCPLPQPAGRSQVPFYSQRRHLGYVHFKARGCRGKSLFRLEKGNSNQSVAGTNGPLHD